MIDIREKAQRDVGEVSEITMILLFELLAEDYLSGKGSNGDNQFREYIDTKCRSTQFKLGPIKDASTIASIYKEYCQEVLPK